MLIGYAFVSISTCDTVTIEPQVTCARKTPNRVRTRGIRVAIVRIQSTLVIVGASFSIARISRFTRTCMTADSVCARSEGMTVVTIRRAFVDIGA